MKPLATCDFRVAGMLTAESGVAQRVVRRRGPHGESGLTS